MTYSLTAALGYVECRGWMIFPVRFGTKRSCKAARYRRPSLGH
jgi:hypothetical protein